MTVKKKVLATLVAIALVATAALAAPRNVKPELIPVKKSGIVSWVLTQPPSDGYQLSIPIVFRLEENLEGRLSIGVESIDFMRESLVNCHFVRGDETLLCDTPADLGPIVDPPLLGLSLEIQPNRWNAETFGRSFSFRWGDGSSIFIVTNEPIPEGDGMTPPADNDSWWGQYFALADDDGCVWHTGIGVVGSGPGGRPDSCGCGPGFCTCGWLECTIEVRGDLLGGSLQQMGGVFGP